MVTVTGDSQAPRVERVADLIGTFLLSYVIALALLLTLIWAGGVWNVLANTRLLDPLISAGLIKYHDMQMGFVDGIPDVQLYLMSKDPVDWGIMGVVVVLILLYWLIKATQFHGLARLNGLTGSFGTHLRAYYYGVGLNSLLPFNVGDLAIAHALKAQGQSFSRALDTLFFVRLFFVFEILFYALVGLIALGWGIWLSQVAWGLVIFLLLYLFLRGTRPGPQSAFAPPLRAALSRLAENPLQLALWAFLSILAFALEHVAAYLTVMAFTSDHVILNVDFSLLVMAIVGGYLARLIPLTPGAIGQFEWGFAAALYLGGLGFPEAVTIALLYGVVRYILGTGLMLAVRMSAGIETNMGTVLASFSRRV